MNNYFKVAEEDVERLKEISKNAGIELNQYERALDIFIEEEAVYRFDEEKESVDKDISSEEREKAIRSIMDNLSSDIGNITDNDHITNLTCEAIKWAIPKFYK